MNAPHPISAVAVEVADPWSAYIASRCADMYATQARIDALARDLERWGDDLARDERQSEEGAGRGR